MNKLLSCLFVLLFSTIALAEMVKSSIGSRASFMSYKEEEVIPSYNMEGLLEWWDAQWNEEIGVHNSAATKINSLTKTGAILEIGYKSKLLQKSVDCSFGGGLVSSNVISLSTDNRFITLPRTIVLCMKFNSYTPFAFCLQLGLGGTDTCVYSNDGYNLKWDKMVLARDISSISPDAGTLVTLAKIFQRGDERIWVNGNSLQVSNYTFAYCIGGGLSFLCNGAFDTNTVNGKFYNAFIYDRALSDEELAEMHMINVQRYLH